MNRLVRHPLPSQAVHLPPRLAWFLLATLAAFAPELHASPGAEFRLIEPAPGAVFDEGEPIPVAAFAWAPDDLFTSAEFFANQQSIGIGIFCCPLCPCAHPSPRDRHHPPDSLPPRPWRNPAPQSVARLGRSHSWHAHPDSPHYLRQRNPTRNRTHHDPRPPRTPPNPSTDHPAGRRKQTAVRPHRWRDQHDWVHHATEPRSQDMGSLRRIFTRRCDRLFRDPTRLQRDPPRVL